MASIAHSYNPDAEPSSGYTPLPAGDYTLEIVESDYGPNAKGNGMALKTKAQVVGSEYDGRPFYLNYVLEHADPQHEEIGQRDFAALRRATGVLSLDDSEKLHFKRFSVKLGIRNNKATGEPQNVIKAYVFDRECAPVGAASRLTSVPVP